MRTYIMVIKFYINKEKFPLFNNSSTFMEDFILKLLVYNFITKITT